MKLEKSLVLNKYLLSLFGFEKVNDLFERLKGVREGYDTDGKSYYACELILLEGLKIPIGDILRYDNAIKEYTEGLVRNRRENINLKYFQYLSVLFSEIFLDNYFHRLKEFLSNLNVFVDFLNEEIHRKENEFLYFEETDLKKLAYWMATGSGKTLIMHINYWQFLKYNKGRLDNIILITPNEGLSKQHYHEMQRSGIPCRLYHENTGSLTLYQNEVLVIDIHKLTEEKKGSGVRVEVESFEGRNLVFIDEGHKGAGTEEKTWKRLREGLAKTGFIFEYSATFGQSIGPKDKDLLREYSKAIIFDYSYKYFYSDGYGKDFYVYNLREKSFQEKFKNLILTGNLLSFYEQILLYEKHREELSEYLIEKPLWAFIGSKVSGAGINSDVLKVVEFLKEISENKSLLKRNIDIILSGKSGLIDLQGNDVFKDRFEHIRREGCKADDIYEKLLNCRSGAFSFFEIKSAEGEIGLKIGEGEYFGVINIGDVSGFKKLLTERGIEVKSDSITPSLFEKVNEHYSNINIIIGAKKFIEGWDSWRVCSMGLINMGKGEGPQIIQLFGRGVRLKGRGFSLKRSDENRYRIKALETLNIFGLNADYINTFLETIRREEVEYEEIQLPIQFINEKKWKKKLYTLKSPEDFDFSSYFFQITVNEDILDKVRIDLRPRVSLAHGLEVTKGESEENILSLEDKYIDLLNWDGIYYELLNYKIAMGYTNLSIDKDTLTEIIRSNGYQLYAFSEQVIPKGFSDLDKLHEIVLMVLKTYIDKFYNDMLRKEESKRLQPVYLVKEDENLAYGEYTVKIEIPADKKEQKERQKFIKKIKGFVKNIEKLYQDDLKEFPRIHFDRHLYTPLLLYKKDKDFIKTIPTQLNEGEFEFIGCLRNYLKAHKERFKNEEIFLLRNLSRKGIRFFQRSGFYPDFIMWRKIKDKQTIAFVDPKGIRHVEDEKIQLHENIKELEKTIGRGDLKLESFILSVSEFKKIKKTCAYSKKDKKDLEREHVLFMEDKEKVINKLFEML
ncbi:MAG: DEAD/DEAH box helicase family protein [Nitrospirae bacterium]|nr:DEAD/DEAH box helicase family protein [Nitrospirota bacterium]